MREKIQAAATMLGISTEQLFQQAYKECSGNIYPIHGPKTIHEKWDKGFVREPPYVRKWIERNVHTIH